MATWNSNQYTLQTSVRRNGEPGVVQRLFFEGVTSTAATGTIYCVKLPPGKIRVYPLTSRWTAANMVASSNVAIGYAAYTAANGAAVTASTGAFEADIASGGGAVDTAWNLPANGAALFDSLDGVTITATVANANTVANGTFSGWVDFTQMG